jgi:hypothetical protein
MTHYGPQSHDRVVAIAMERGKYVGLHVRDLELMWSCLPRSWLYNIRYYLLPRLRTAESCSQRAKMSHPDSSETNSRLFPEGEALSETIFRVFGLQYRPHSAVEHISLLP